MNKEKIYEIIRAPVISEKAAILSDSNNQIVLKVDNSANKLQIKNAVELIFKVKVEAVRTAKYKGKVKKNRYGLAVKSDYKKAYVQIAKGEQVNFTEF